MAEELLDRVDALVREVAQTIVLPRWRHLGSDEVREKSPGDLVTIADQESERALTAGLTALLPGSIVVGEEAVAADKSILQRVGNDGAVWIVDPVDGTNNFAAGKTPFAVMVALLRDGEQAAAWILDVVSDRMVRAEAGAGAYADGVRLTTRTDAPAAAALSGTVSHNQIPAGLRDEVADNAAKFAEVTAGHHCAGYEYPAVVLDEQQFAVFWRILPWDHAPGSLIVREAGGTVLRLDGSAYRPAEEGPGLLVAPNEEIWQTVRGTLLS